MGILDSPMVLPRNGTKEEWPKTIAFSVMIRVRLQTKELLEKTNFLEIGLKVSGVEKILGKQSISTDHRPKTDKDVISVTALMQISGFDVPEPGNITAIVRTYNHNNEMISEQETARKFPIELEPLEEIKPNPNTDQTKNQTI